MEVNQFGLAQYYMPQARSQVFLRGGAIYGGGGPNENGGASLQGELGCLTLYCERFEKHDISQILNVEN